MDQETVIEREIINFQKKEQELGFLNSIVSNMNEPTEIKRNRMVTKGGIVKDLRNITQEVK
jgi:hypothetical protein